LLLASVRAAQAHKNVIVNEAVRLLYGLRNSPWSTST
jgi:hypothetical protein